MLQLAAVCERIAKKERNNIACGGEGTGGEIGRRNDTTRIVIFSFDVVSDS